MFPCNSRIIHKPVLGKKIATAVAISGGEIGEVVPQPSSIGDRFLTTTQSEKYPTTYKFFNLT